MRLNLIIVAILLLVFSGLAIAQDKAEAKADTKAVSHDFVGDKKCKTCHKDVHTSWLETKHAKTFDVLSDEEKNKLQTHISPTIVNSRGIVVGAIRPAASWLSGINNY